MGLIKDVNGGFFEYLYRSQIEDDDGGEGREGGERIRCLNGRRAPGATVGRKGQTESRGKGRAQARWGMT
jgi:hypothetical protein